jgi:hypothetical protein
MFLKEIRPIKNKVKSKEEIDLLYENFIEQQFI